MQTPAYILSAAQITDGHGDLIQIEQLIQLAQAALLPIQTLTIDPLSAGWNTPIKTHHFRSGNAPLEALSTAVDAIEKGDNALYILHGKDHLRSDYERDERHRLMNIYENLSLPDAYTQLAFKMMAQFDLSEDEFIDLRSACFENYWQTYKTKAGAKKPDTKWFDPLTSLYRGVDCANPLMDYEGLMLLGSEYVVRMLGSSVEKAIKVESVSVSEIKSSGMNALDEIAKFEHLKSVYTEACDKVNIDFTYKYLNREACLEAYTCYPVVPIAFLLANHFVNNKESLLEFLSRYPITITGGMNLAKAPWNNPALRGLISACETLQEGEFSYAGVQGNGGLGEKQGFAMLSKVEKF